MVPAEYNNMTNFLTRSNTLTSARYYIENIHDNYVTEEITGTTVQKIYSTISTINKFIQLNQARDAEYPSLVFIFISIILLNHKLCQTKNQHSGQKNFVFFGINIDKIYCDNKQRKIFTINFQKNH